MRERKTVLSSKPLLELFNQLNEEHFNYELDPPDFFWNSRMRASAGRFTPNRSTKNGLIPARIEVARYLIFEQNSKELIKDTIGHELIHYWLWLMRKPYGHTPEFRKKMQEMGVSRYNIIESYRPYKHVFECIGCKTEFFFRRRFSKKLACAACCDQLNGGTFDSRFRLVFKRSADLHPDSPDQKRIYSNRGQ